MSNVIQRSDIVVSTATNLQPTAGPATQYVILPIANPDDNLNTYCKFSKTYINPPINRVGDYYLSLESAQIATRDIPAFIFPTDLQIGVCHNLSNVAAGEIETVTNFMETIQWVPQQMGLGPASGGGGTVEGRFCYSFEHFVNLVNTTLNTAWTAASSPGGSDNYPYGQYNEVTKLFTFVLPNAFKDAGGSNTWTVCWNRAFDNLLNNFNVIENGPDMFILEDTLSGFTNNGTAENGNAAVVLTQDGATIDYFNSAESLIVTTSVPINPAYYPNPGNDNTGAQENILAEIPLDFNNNPDIMRGKIVYTPPFRMYHEVQQVGPIRRFDADVYWVDSQSNRYPIRIASTDRSSLVLGFFKKSETKF